MRRPYKFKGKKKLSEQEVLDAVDCCLNPESEVDCRRCPLHGIKTRGGCKRLTLDAVVNHIQELRMQNTTLHTSLQEKEKKDPNRNYSVQARVKNGIIYAKTLKDYDNLIGDISQSTVEEMINEISSRIWKSVPDHVSIPFDGRFVSKDEFISMLRISGGLE